MNRYEVTIECMTPCGGSKYARREILEIEAESPLAYVEQNRQYPILEILEEGNGEVTILTGNAVGYKTRYYFSL